MKFLLLFFITLNLLFAQQSSIHQIQSEYFSNQVLQKNSGEKISYPNKQFFGSKLNKLVFGYLPDWEYYNGTHKNIRYDLISHLAVFPFQTDSSGNLTDPYAWPWNDVINSCAAANVKLIASVTCFNGSDIHSLLTDEIKRSNLFANIKTKLQTWGFAGVNIDFENLLNIDKPGAMGNFIRLLNQYLKAVNQNYEISTAVYPVNFDNWGYDSIAEYSDLLFVMSYNYYGSWSTTTGPSAPFEGTYYNVSKSFANDLGSIAAKFPRKMLLGVAYCGNYWKTKTKDAYANVDTAKTKKGFINTLFYRDIIPAYEQKEKLWDNISKTPWLRWQDSDSTWNQIWYDNDSSLAIKYNLAIEKKLGGIGIWALGYDNGRDELWKLIERKFTGEVGIENETIPVTFQLYQNYPNPFNPETTIEYQIVKSGNVTLKVYDLLGREIAALVNEFKQPGVYNSEFSVQNFELPSGIYFYTLRSGENVQTKKMIILK